jgi:hypothetical protein
LDIYRGLLDGVDCLFQMLIDFRVGNFSELGAALGHGVLAAIIPIRRTQFWLRPARDAELVALGGDPLDALAANFLCRLGGGFPAAFSSQL